MPYMHLNWSRKKGNTFFNGKTPRKCKSWPSGVKQGDKAGVHTQTSQGRPHTGQSHTCDGDTLCGLVDQSQWDKQSYSFCWVPNWDPWQSQRHILNEFFYPGIWVCEVKAESNLEISHSWKSKRFCFIKTLKKKKVCFIHLSNSNARKSITVSQKTENVTAQML